VISNTWVRRGLATVLGIAAVAVVIPSAAPAQTVADRVVNGCTIVENPTPDHFTICPFADLAGAQLNGVNLSDAHLGQANFTGAHLSGANFTRANLNGARLTDAILSNATLDWVSSGQVKGTPASLPENWTIVRGYLIGPKAKIVAADLAGADLTGMDLEGAQVHDTSFSDATMHNIRLSGIQTALVNFSGAKLNGAIMNGGNALFDNFTGTDLTGAHITSSTISGSKFDRSIFTGATLTGTKFGRDFFIQSEFQSVVSGGVVGTPDSLPLNWQVVNGYLVGPTANLHGALLSNAHVIDADFTGADLTGATFAGATVSNSSFTRANLMGTTLAGATLTGVSSGGIVTTPASLPGTWTIIHDYLMGPTANLTGADLTGANLTGADLTGATLTGVISGRIAGTPTSLPTKWQLLRGYLIGPGGNLSNALLDGADLVNIDLAHTILTGAHLSGANFTQTDLTGADLARADLKDAHLNEAKVGGVTWNNTTCPDGVKSEDEGYICFRPDQYWSYIDISATAGASTVNCESKYGDRGTQLCSGVWNWKTGPQPDIPGWPFNDLQDATWTSARYGEPGQISFEFFTPQGEFKGTTPSDDSDRFVITSAIIGSKNPAFEAPREFAQRAPGTVGGPLNLQVEGTCPTPHVFCHYDTNLKGYVIASK
jgi:uncharacterized protein YjbI with pentapeptide repeats